MPGGRVGRSTRTGLVSIGKPTVHGRRKIVINFFVCHNNFRTCTFSGGSKNVCITYMDQTQVFFVGSVLRPYVLLLDGHDKIVVPEEHLVKLNVATGSRHAHNLDEVPILSRL